MLYLGVYRGLCQQGHGILLARGVRFVTYFVISDSKYKLYTQTSITNYLIQEPEMPNPIMIWLHC